MSTPTELALVSDLIKGTREGKLRWRRLADPESYRFTTNLASGRVFGLSAPLVLPTVPGLRDVRLEIRTGADELIATIATRVPKRKAELDAALRELLDLVAGESEEALEDTLKDLQRSIS